MFEYLKAEEANEQLNILISDFSTDPERLIIDLEQSARRHFLAKEAEAAIARADLSMEHVVNRLLEGISALERHMPVRQSLFRGGEDSIRTYHAIAPFFSFFEESCKSFRENVISLAQLREELWRTRLELMHAECACSTLLLHAKEKSRPSLERLLEMLRLELQLQNRLLKETEARILKWRTFDTQIVQRFLENMRIRSDSAHDGAACDCTAVTALLGELKRALARLLTDAK